MDYGSSDKFHGLWASDKGDRSDYHEAAPSDAEIRSIETELGYRLPTAYIDLARSHNGGLLRRDAHASPSPTTWSDDYVVLTGIFAIGRTAEWSLCGSYGQRLWLNEWGYPALGVYIADTPSAGHDMIALDYRTVGPQGEPSVVHVNQEAGYAVTRLAAATFGEFIAGLVEEDSFPD